MLIGKNNYSYGGHRGELAKNISYKIISEQNLNSY